MACPRILLGVDDEALHAVSGGMGGQRAASSYMAAISAVQHDAVLREHHFHRDLGLDGPKINPIARHFSWIPDLMPVQGWLRASPTPGTATAEKLALPGLGRR